MLLIVNADDLAFLLHSIRHKTELFRIFVDKVIGLLNFIFRYLLSSSLDCTTTTLSSSPFKSSLNVFFAWTDIY